MFKSFLVALGIILAGLFSGHNTNGTFKTQPAAIAVAVSSNETVPATRTSTRSSLIAPAFVNTGASSERQSSPTDTPAIAVQPAPAAILSDYVTQDELAVQFQEAANDLRGLIYQNESAPNSLPATGGNFNNIAITSAIDRLSGTTLNDVTVHGVSGLAAADIPVLNYFPATSTVSVSYGGTGTSTPPLANQLLLSDAEGNWEYVATSSLGISGGASPWTTGGGNISFGSGNVGIGTTSPSYPLDVAGFINTDLFSGYKQGGSNVLIASSTLHDAFIGTLAAFPPIDTTGANALDPSECSSRYGFYDTGVGVSAAASLTAGCVDTALGWEALENATSSMGDTALGANVLTDDTNGLAETGVGYETMSVLTTGNFNAGLGNGAMQDLVTGGNNTAVGGHSMLGDISGDNNVAVGQGSLGADSTNGTPTYDVAVGGSALTSNTTGVQNTVIGGAAGWFNTTANSNSSLGYETLWNDTTGGNNVAIGGEALSGFNNSATFNNEVAVGDQAGTNEETGSADVFVGFQAGFVASSSVADTFVGYDAGNFASTTNDTFIGKSAGAGTAAVYNTGTSNTGVGTGSFIRGTSGSQNTALGASTLTGTLGSNTFTKETAIGFDAGLDDTTGIANTMIGYLEGLGLTSGRENTLVGSCDTTGCENQVTTGQQNITIGYDVQLASPTSNGQLDIGNEIYGTGLTGTGSTVSSGNIGVGTTTPSAKFSVGGAVGDTSGSAYFTGGLGVGVLNTTAGTLQTSGNATIGGCVNYNGGTSGTCLSDERVKQDINPYSSGLQDVIALDPVTYKYNGLAGTPNDGDVRMGLIAQQVELVAPDLVSTTSALLSASDTAPTQLLEVNYGALPFVLINALKEIVAISDEFKSNLIAWLGDAGNGITDIFAGNIHAKDELCVGSTCVTPAQFQAMVAAAGEPNAVGTVSAPASTDATDTPPVISINGENPAIIQVGDTYADLGATITGPQADINLGIHAFVGDTPIEQAVIDTSTPTTYHIYYVATDAAGNTSTSTRTVIVQAASTATTTSDTGTGDTATTTSTGSQI